MPFYTISRKGRHPRLGFTSQAREHDLLNGYRLLITGRSKSEGAHE